MSDNKRNKGWENLQGKRYSFANMDKEKHRELSRKGAEKSHQVARERRTAKQALEDILKLDCTPGIIENAELPEELKEIMKVHADSLTLYDLLMCVAVGVGVGGNVRALEFVRDSVGDMPTKQVRLDSNDLMTDADRQMLEHLTKLIESGERLDIVKTIEAMDDNTQAAGGKNEIRSIETWKE